MVEQLVALLARGSAAMLEGVLVVGSGVPSAMELVVVSVDETVKEWVAELARGLAAVLARGSVEAWAAEWVGMWAAG